MSSWRGGAATLSSGPNPETRVDPPVWTVVLAGACAFLTLYATQPILPLLAREFHVDKAGVSLTVLASTIGVALAAPWMGLLADRLGRRRMIIASALALGATSLAGSSSANLAQLVCWRFLQGVFTPGVFSVTVAYINEEWTARRAGWAIAAYVSGTVLGGFFGRLTSGFVTDHAGWRSGLLALGFADLAMTVVLWKWLPREVSRTHVPESGRTFEAIAAHLRNRALAVRYAIGFFVLFTLVTTFTYVTFYLAAPPFELRPAYLGLIFVVYLFGAAVTPIAGRWLDRLGSQKTLMRAAGLGMAGILLTLERNIWAVAAGLAIASTGVFIAQAAINRSLGQCAKDNRALAAGLYATFYYLGGSVGATAPAYAWRLGGWHACVALVLAAQAATLGMARWIWSTPGEAGERLVAGE